MTHTTNYNLNLPAGTDPAAIEPLNQNFTLIDTYLKSNLNQMAEDYDSTEIYNTDNIVAHDNGIYKCLDDGVTGTWDSTKWEATTLGEEVGQGGGSSVVVNPSGTQDEVLDGLEVEGTNYGLDVVGEINDVAVASFSDGVNLPINKAIVNITAVQSGSGEPSPENIRPISGWSGCNLYIKGINQWDEQWEAGTYDTSTGLPISSSNRIRSKNPISILPSTTYRGLCANNLAIRALYYGIDGDYLGINEQVNNTTFTTPSDAYFMQFMSSSAYGTTYKSDIGINYPSSDTTYHAYNPNSITRQVDFGQDIYGAQADLIGGSGIIKDNAVDLGNLTWYMSQSGQFYCDDLKSGQQVYPPIKPTTWGQVPNNCKISNDYIWVKGSLVETTNKSISIDGLGRIYTHDGSYTSAADYKTSLSGITLLYEQNEPIPFTFTSIPTTNTLEGVNNVYADTGNINKLGYFKGGKLTRSIKAIIEAMTGNVNAILADAIGEE